MKKLLSVLLLIFAMLLSACGGVKYEYKDGVMYEDGKEATGTFEFKSGKYKVKGNFENGLPNGLLEKYYSDGSIMVKDTFVNGINTKEEIYYKNGKLMEDVSNNRLSKLYYDDGSLVMFVDIQTEETIFYHENGNPLMTIIDKEVVMYDENNEMLSKVEDGKAVDIGITQRKLADGSSEFVKDNKIVAKIDANKEIGTYFYSTGEPLMRFYRSTDSSEIFFKNGTTLFKSEGNERVFNYRDGKPLYKAEGNIWKFYNEEGDEIIANFDVITDIKKID